MVDECDKADWPPEVVLELLEANYEREALSLGCASFALSVGEGLAGDSDESLAVVDLLHQNSACGEFNRVREHLKRRAEVRKSKDFWRGDNLFCAIEDVICFRSPKNLRLGLLSRVISDIT